MNSHSDKTGGRPRTRLGALICAAALAVALVPGDVAAQSKPAQVPNVGSGVKRTTFGNWHLLCNGPNCAIATNAVRGVLVFGFNSSDGSLVMQVRLPTDSPEGRPVAIRLHKSGTLLQLRVGACDQSYCAASAASNKTGQVVDLFTKEASGTLGYQLAQQMQLEVFSLNGFSKAMAELRKRQPPAKARN